MPSEPAPTPNRSARARRAAAGSSTCSPGSRSRESTSTCRIRRSRRIYGGGSRAGTQAVDRRPGPDLPGTRLPGTRPGLRVRPHPRLRRRRPHHRRGSRVAVRVPPRDETRRLVDRRPARPWPDPVDHAARPHLPTTTRLTTCSGDRQPTGRRPSRSTPRRHVPMSSQAATAGCPRQCSG